MKLRKESIQIQDNRYQVKEGAICNGEGPHRITEDIGQCSTVCIGMGVHRCLSYYSK